MIIRRLSALQLVLLGGLGSVFLLPKDIKLQPAAIDPSLPEFIDTWQGAEQPITKQERDLLGPDTQISRRLYTDPKGDEVFVSIVMSGPDMNTSIHRPERCLPAQGWTISDSRTVALPFVSSNLKATRLHNIRSVQMDSGKSVMVNGLNYYWFVGHSDITASHLTRTWIDIRDRVLKGENQQWAYVTIGATITQGLKVFGRDEGQTDEIIQNFIRAFAAYQEKQLGPSHALHTAGN